MSNELRFTRRVKTDAGGKPHSDGYSVYREHTLLGVVRRYNTASWNAEYDGKTIGTYRSREEAGDRLWAEHRQRWGLQYNGDPKADPRPTSARYAVVEGRELDELIERLTYAKRTYGRARFTVHNGLKIDAGLGWSAAIGRPADETGH